jgi:hypothetical protein
VRTTNAHRCCFRRLNVAVRWSRSSLHAELLRLNQKAVMKLQICDNADNGNRQYISVPVLRYAWPRAEPQGHANEFPRSGPIVLALNRTGLFLLLLVLCIFPPCSAFQTPTKTSSAHVSQSSLPETTHFFVKIPARTSVLHFVWCRPCCSQIRSHATDKTKQFFKCTFIIVCVLVATN